MSVLTLFLVSCTDTNSGAVQRGGVITDQVHYLRSSSLSKHQLTFISRHLSAAADTADIIVPRSPPSSSALRAAAVLPPGEVTSS